MDTAKIYALLKFFNAMGKTVSLVPVKTLEQFQQSEHFSVMLQFLRTGMYQKKTSTGNVKALLLDHLQETFGEEYVSLCSLQKLNKGNLWEISKLMALCVHAIYQRQELADKVNDMVLKQLKDDQLKHVRQIVTGMRKSDSKHWTQILKEGGHCRPPSLTQQGAEQKDSKLGKTIQSLSFSGKSDFKKSSVMSKLLKDRVNQEGENTFKPMVKLKEACLSASQPRTQGKLEVKERKTGRKRTQSESKQRTPKKERLNLNEANSKTIKEIEDSTVKRSNKVVAATKEKSPKNIKLAKETGTSGSNNDKGGGWKKYSRVCESVRTPSTENQKEEELFRRVESLQNEVGRLNHIISLQDTRILETEKTVVAYQRHTENLTVVLSQREVEILELSKKNAYNEHLIKILQFQLDQLNELKAKILI